MVLSIVAPNLTGRQNHYIWTHASTFRDYPNEDRCHVLSSAPRWIKLQRGSAAFSYTIANSDPDTYGNSDPDTYRNANTCCHSAPAVGSADFALTRPLASA